MVQMVNMVFNFYLVFLDISHRDPMLVLLHGVERRIHTNVHPKAKRVIGP